MANYSGAFWADKNVESLTREEIKALRLARERAAADLRRLLSEPDTPNLGLIVAEQGRAAIDTHLKPAPHLRAALERMVDTIIESPKNAREFGAECEVERTASYENVEYDPALIDRETIEDLWVGAQRGAHLTKEDPHDRFRRCVEHCHRIRSGPAWPSYVNDGLRYYCLNTDRRKFLGEEQV